MDGILKKIEGLQTIETVAELLDIKETSALNLISRLKRKGYITTSGGGKQKRLYKITTRKQRKRDPGMFDIINRYSPHMKLNPWYDHQVHGKYGPEEALIDAIKTKSFRVILASLRLFAHIKDWKKLRMLARENDCSQQVGALYDLARMHFRVKRMLHNNILQNHKNFRYLIRNYRTKEENFKKIENKWKVGIPFRMGDMDKVVS